jgi:hypothetical protein
MIAEICTYIVAFVFGFFLGKGFHITLTKLWLNTKKMLKNSVVDARSMNQTVLIFLKIRKSPCNSRGGGVKKWAQFLFSGQLCQTLECK